MKVSDWHGVLVFVEAHQGKIADVSLELLGEAGKLSNQLNCKIIAVTVDLAKDNESLIGYGADTVYALETGCAGQMDDLRYVDAICQLIDEIHPEIFLIGSTMLGKSIAPRIASRLETGLTADCIEFSIDKETRNLLQVRPAFQDSLFATIVCAHKRPQIATVRENIFQPNQFDYDRIGQVIKKKYTLEKNTKLEIMEQAEIDQSAIKLENKIVFGIGQGIGSKENVELVKQVAERYGAAIGATRSVVNEGWIEKECQIGQTGITVRPKVYIACGISGAIQHLCGIQGAECIIAINTDKNAPIFKVADVGIQEDVVRVLNCLLENASMEKTFV